MTIEKERLSAAIVAAARSWSVVYADGEGAEAQEPYLEKLAAAVSEWNDWAAQNPEQAIGIPESFLTAAREAPSIMDVLEDPTGPAAKPLFPGLTNKGEG